MIYIGIDPGKEGALAMLTEDSASVNVFDIPTYKSILKNIKNMSMRCVCFLENVHSMPKQGVQSSFNFGENFGLIQGLLIACDIPYELVTPQKWKKEFQVTSDKNTSISVCKRLFPDVCLRKSERCRKDHDGMAEALLLAEYARRKAGVGHGQ